ncbi:Gfo/Idh/MocA family oxidoreductase [Hyphomonas sp. WL0036]|uniref:Gfo/Idh/MocA family protein n=1 Tax=Hyphomonas sediminis TaxID=2866160 RepID=UPI001C819C84|nr:Gfo/Idh/MocA family oxidoreductase [Hyphomonas sediminis]MBY9068465.1 Gfo/Idh/MocA family oxidoreductase [Hyphomonas sediminis]
MIRIGILGAAKIAPKSLIPQVKRRSDCIVSAIAARDTERARAYAQSHAIPEVVESYEALISHPEIDLIYNALPPHQHASLSIAALEAGKHVLCEKPFAMNVSEARQMVDTATRADRHLIEGFHYRFHPMFLDILDKVRSGAIGRLCAMKAEFSVAIPFSTDELRHRPDLGGGAIMDLGCYPLHWLRTVAGTEPRLISTDMTQGAPGIDLVTEALMEFPGGIPARLRTSMKPDQKFRAVLAIKGSEGILRANNPIHPTLGNSISIQRGTDITRYTTDGETTFDYQLAHVLDVIAGKAEPLTGGEDAVANMAMIDAIYEAGGLSPRGL